MSESRWNDATTRALPGDAPPAHPGQRTHYARGAAGHGLPPSAEPSPRWGGLPAGRGIVLVVAADATGTVLTILVGRDPGFVLGFFLLAGTVAASFAVQPRAVYRIIPVPALAYIGGAIIAGLIHDRAADTSRTALAINAAQWSASGFLVMVIATVLVLLVGAMRFVRLWRRSGGIGGRVPAGPRPGSRSQAGSPRRVSSPARPGPGRPATARSSASSRDSASSGSAASSRGPSRRPGPGDAGGRRPSSPPGSGH
jgi:hypothetical protein